MTPPRCSFPALLLTSVAALAGCTLELIDNDPPAQPGCGNGIVEPGEVCDDGNQEGGDGCAPLCDSTELCGNFIVDAHLGEQCDAGGGAHAACDPDCTAPVCGDGLANPAAGEVCDDGNTASDDGCRSDCRSDETCGNAVLDHHLAKNGQSHPQECLDAVAQGTGCAERCDDGNNVTGDGCSANCLSEEACGNQIRDPGEQCDDGNMVHDDACRNDCLVPGAMCGNQQVDPPEQCDGGPGGSSACDADCTLPECGDSFVNGAAGEQCDPGQIGVPTATCDPNFTFPLCGDGYRNLAAGEQCDDGNAVDGDGCRNDCTLP